MVDPRDTAGNAEEEEEWWTPEIQLGTQKKKNDGLQRYSWERRRRRRRMVDPRDTAGNAEEEEEENPDTCSPWHGSLLDHVVHLAGVQQVLELAQQSRPLFASTLGVDEDQQWVCALQRRDLK